MAPLDTDALRVRFRALRCDAAFYALRAHGSAHEQFVVRRDVADPPRLATSAGAMLTVADAGGAGYCATSDLSAAGLQAALDCAARWAVATRGTGPAIDGAPPAAPCGGYITPAGTAWPGRAEVLDLLAAECAAAGREAHIVDRVVGLDLVDETRLYLSSAGADVLQHFRFTLPQARVTASRGADAQTRSLEHAQQGGYEQIARSGLLGCGARLAEEALVLLAAPDCPSGVMDLLLMPDQMMLQIHESIGHPLELDRILGDERNYAGTSFVRADMFGRYRYGSPLLNVSFDPDRSGELASYAFDDEGLEARKVWLIRDGVLQVPLGGLRSQRRSGLAGAASARASGWNRPAIDRMANLNVEPGTSTLDELLASVRHGVLMRTNRSWSIDDARNKFQFGCEWGERIENGRRAGVVKNPNYRGISSTFWRSLRGVGNADTFELHGTLYCGKGEPNQAIHCGHAAPACVFADVDVFGGA